MALSRFPKAFDDNIVAVQSAGDAIRYVVGASGDLLFRDIDRIQSGLELAKVTFGFAFAEASKSPIAATEEMQRMGGPASLQEYGGHAQTIETAASAWNQFLDARLQEVPVIDLIALATNPGTGTRRVERGLVIKGALAASIRSSSELAFLLGSFEAVGG